MQIRSNIQSSEISFDAGHVLYVEGEPDSIDVKILSAILPISVKPMGASFYIKGTAEALYKTHPRYYFLIDRDHYADDVIEDYWARFPLADTPNLLIWRKKEIESYFLDPAFLRQSSYFNGRKNTLDNIRSRILKSARLYVYMAAANQVIISIREQLKRSWIEVFRTKEDFPTVKAALAQLRSRPEFKSFGAEVTSVISESSLLSRFNEFLTMLTGGAQELVWGKGRWLDLLPAKGIMHDVMQSSLFTVKDRMGHVLKNQEKEYEIIRDLLKPNRELPSDFVALRELLEKRMAHQAL